MPDVLAAQHEQHLFGHVLGVVPDALQSLECQHGINGGLEIALILHDQRQDLPQCGLEFPIQLDVTNLDMRRHAGVGLIKSAHRAAQHACREIRHMPQILRDCHDRALRLPFSQAQREARDLF